MPPNDFYAILGVRRNATIDEIQEAYRDKARHFAAGREHDAEPLSEWLQSLRAAWDTLSDPVRRAEYDATHQGGSDNGRLPESLDSPEQLKRRIAELEAELAMVRRQRDTYYRWVYHLTDTPISNERAEELIAEPEGTPILEILAEYEGSLKE